MSTTPVLQDEMLAVQTMDAMDADDATARPAAPSIARASVILTAATLVASGGNYLLNLLLARWMTPSDFGDANLIVTLMLGITAVAVALQLIAAHRVSTSGVSASFGHRRRLLRRAWGVGFGVGALLAASSPVLRDVTSSASALPFVILAAGLPPYLAQAVERGVLQGGFHFGRLAQTLIVEATARLGVAITLVAAGFGVVGATAGITASFVASWWWGRRSVAATFTHGAPREARDVLPPAHGSAERLATHATMILLAGQIAINNGDVVLAKALFDPNTAGVYAVVALVGRAIFFLSWSVVTAAFPHATTDDGAAVQRQAVRTVAVMAAVMTVAVAIAAPPLTPIVFGEDYRSAGPLFAPYAIATSLFAVANVYATLGVARGRRSSGWIVVVGALVQTALLLVAATTASQMVWLQVGAMGLLLAGCASQSHRAASVAPDVAVGR